jgi:hypothetical protein
MLLPNSPQAKYTILIAVLSFDMGYSFIPPGGNKITFQADFQLVPKLLYGLPISC